ncbi:Electron transport complex protein RnfC [Halanaerobium saccharolyticum subsp. saccharolyticum DSM 6643]|uniref:Ion-translocating oxidoreductase complex subunit C n=1 Tax=Halanaerobium saccharolyticum subsp. saccharolyticum DSM 6643 TaxID=1293054 RepID=M5DZE5_9FIRM|nr:electron transport complex subunit RsxC [Halanaerobium saccharolyticum]CCU78485.1 Electron transport complex protein RnfC [Halanaerobium saccharolyticum subsp. saccharolyticum DSM 6643]
MKALTFKQGIHPAYNKDLTKDKPLKNAKRPEEVIIPIKQHIGAPLKALVKKGDQVDLGQKIADGDSFVCAPIHASVSGTVKEIKKVTDPGGNIVDAVVIESAAEDTLNSGLERHDNLDNLNADDIRNIIREAGIVGMGGAMFPTHVKVSTPDDKNVDYVILNGAECEPYLTVDHRVMVERPESIIFGLKALMKASGAPKGIIGIEENKPEAIESMKDASKNDTNIEVQALETKYPQGGEKMLIDALISREVPAGGLPLDVGVVVNNTSTAAAVADAIRDGKPFYERSITITGRGINSPQNLIYRIGTTIGDLIEEAGGLKENAAKVITGGPMMGAAQKQLNIPAVKGTSGILVLVEDEVEEFEPSPCINCAKCVDACPMFLMPTQLVDYAKNEMVEKLEEWQVLSCIECGSCSYVCPAKIPLVHHLRLGKAQVMAKKREEN